MSLEIILITLTIGVICTLLGAWVGYRLAISKQKSSDRTSIIRDVAEKYHDFRENNDTSDLDGLIRSGVARLCTHNEIEVAIQLIKKFGHKDPLRDIRGKLEGKDLHNFISIIQKNNLNLQNKMDLEKAFQEAKLL